MGKLRLVSRLNLAYLEDLQWELRWGTKNQMAAAVADYRGKGRNTMFWIFSSDRRNVSLDMLDGIYGALVERMVTLGVPVPDDLWNRLILHEWPETTDESSTFADNTL